jgi:hypothetical protein
MFIVAYLCFIIMRRGAMLSDLQEGRARLVPPETGTPSASGQARMWEDQAR